VPVLGASPRVAIVGAGLAGPLLAIYLARRGLRVDVYERRPDPRQGGDDDAGRSINLGLSQRGIQALRRVGLLDAVWARTVPMRGRMIHAAAGALRFQPYGTNSHEILHSVRRSDLRAILLDHAETLPGVKLAFGTGFVRLDHGGPVVRDGGAERHVAADAVVGADGVFSKVRQQMQQGRRADYHQEFLDWGYKELTIPAGTDGRPRTELRALHVWPGRTGLIVAHPNQDGGLTGTLFLPLEGRPSFASVTTPSDVTGLFGASFPDALELMPDLVEEFAANPVGHLVSVRTAPWHDGGRAVLVGDAAHGTYPFYGQGMNAAFEDCMVLDECLAHHPRDWATAFSAYQRRRKPHTDVLDDLSRQNFEELREGVRSPLTLARKRADLVLNKLFPQAWVPLYTMVSHTTTPYADALRRARRQDAVLAWLGAGLGVGTAVGAGTAGLSVARALRLQRDRDRGRRDRDRGRRDRH
jgi:kynurenine 3-monooxygenase